MSWEQIGEYFLSYLFGSLVTGLVAYVALKQAVIKNEMIVKSIKSQILDMKTNCTALRLSCQKQIGENIMEAKKNIDKMEADVKDHHVKGPHITEDFKRMLKDQYDEMCDRLGSIEKHLRAKNGGVYP